jgi:hypothetical protein
VWWDAKVETARGDMFKTSGHVHCMQTGSKRQARQKKQLQYFT